MPVKTRVLLPAGIAAAAVTVSVVTSGAFSQAASSAPSCSVTPVIAADVPTGAGKSQFGHVSVAVSFNVVGSCTATQLGAASWEGHTINNLGALEFSYHAGNRPQVVEVHILDFGEYEVFGEVLNGSSPAGLTVNGTTFTLRRGTTLEATREVANTKAGTTAITLLAQQYLDGAVTERNFPAGSGWAPLPGRVYFQNFANGKWNTRKSAVLNSHGVVVVTVTTAVLDRLAIRFIVPGTAARMLPAGEFAAGREPAIDG